jgi:hypothetical protein
MQMRTLACESARRRRVMAVLEGCVPGNGETDGQKILLCGNRVICS